MPPKVAFVFPGQGSQKVGMGKDLHENSAQARELWEQADDALGFALSKLCFEGPSDDLKLTENTQPAILTHSVIAARLLGLTPHMAAGHSLGEYSAYVAAGAIEFVEALKLVRNRGRYMQQAVPEGVGAMMALIGVDTRDVEEGCEKVEGVVTPANYNGGGQIIISGEAEAVRLASHAIELKRALPLPVSAPFHCPLMKPAEEKLQPELDAMEFNAPKFPVFRNIDALLVDKAEFAREGLIQQVSRPVRWEQCVKAMWDERAETYVELGPGRVLGGLIRRILTDVTTLSVESYDDIAKARDQLADALA